MNVYNLIIVKKYFINFIPLPVEVVPVPLPVLELQVES
jgi:hypothetical protein